MIDNVVTGMKKFVLYVLKLYQILISPVFRQVFGNTCRYNPTCSEYTRQSIEKYGIIKGGVMGFRQLITCHPFIKKPGQREKKA